ncbi:GerMN domain-containing protein [bacterium]|nr:GerMN domain-containing protein [bacterium]
MKSNRKFVFLIILLVVFMSLVFYIRAKKVVRERRIWQEVVLYLADFSSPKGPSLVPVKMKVEKEDALNSAIELLIHPPPYLRGVSSPLPRGTRLISAEVKGDTAYLNFSKELKDNFLGGSTNEMLVVYGIVNTACSINGIKRVQILIEGKNIESLGGHLEIMEPLEPNREIVR